MLFEVVVDEDDIDDFVHALEVDDVEHHGAAAEDGHELVEGEEDEQQDGDEHQHVQIELEARQVLRGDPPDVLQPLPQNSRAEDDLAHHPHAVAPQQAVLQHNQPLPVVVLPAIVCEEGLEGGEELHADDGDEGEDGDG